MKGPAAVVTPETPAQVPIAHGRSRGWKEPWMIARAPGVSSAAPQPCSTRARTSHPMSGESAHASEATANHTIPMR